MPPVLEGRIPIVFSDFDGTITQRDVIIMIMEAFAPPGWRDIVDQILNRRTLTLKEGVPLLFRAIPGSRREEIETFVAQNVTLRDGFPEFLAECQAREIPFLVVSGGVDFFIRPVLADFQAQLEIFCNGAEFYPDRIELTSPYPGTHCQPCGECNCCKLSIMDRYPKEQYYRIALGDSLTDLPMARVADWTFARGQLVDYCKEENIAVTPYESFHDIRQALFDKLAGVTPIHG